MPRPLNLSSLDREIVWASTAFLESRLRERGIFDWAAGLNATRLAEREAIRDLLNYRSPDLDDHYRTAWTWVFEAWDEPALREGARSEMIDALQGGYDPLVFVSTIAELV